MLSPTRLPLVGNPYDTIRQTMEMCSSGKFDNRDEDSLVGASARLALRTRHRPDDNREVVVAQPLSFKARKDDCPALSYPGMPLRRDLAARLPAQRGRSLVAAAGAHPAALDLLLCGPLRAARRPGR